MPDLFISRFAIHPISARNKKTFELSELVGIATKRVAKYCLSQANEASALTPTYFLHLYYHSNASLIVYKQYPYIGMDFDLVIVQNSAQNYAPGRSFTHTFKNASSVFKKVLWRSTFFRNREKAY